jgi:hypothetical protein
VPEEDVGDRTRDPVLQSLSAVVRASPSDFLAGEVQIGYVAIRDRGSSGLAIVAAEALFLEGRVLISRFEIARSVSARLHCSYRFTAGANPEIDGLSRSDEIRWHAIGLGFGMEYRFNRDR